MRVTDLGETLRHLASQGIDVLGSAKRRFMLEQIARRLHVVVAGGTLDKEAGPSEIGGVVLDVAAAAHGAAVFAYTSTTYEPAEFPEEVSAFLRDNDIDHELRARVRGLTAVRWRLDWVTPSCSRTGASNLPPSTPTVHVSRLHNCRQPDITPETIHACPPSCLPHCSSFTLTHA